MSKSSEFFTWFRSRANSLLQFPFESFKGDVKKARPVVDNLKPMVQQQLKTMDLLEKQVSSLKMIPSSIDPQKVTASLPSNVKSAAEGLMMASMEQAKVSTSSSEAAVMSDSEIQQMLKQIDEEIQETDEKLEDLLELRLFLNEVMSVDSTSSYKEVVRRFPADVEIAIEEHIRDHNWINNDTRLTKEVIVSMTHQGRNRNLAKVQETLRAQEALGNASMNMRSLINLLEKVCDCDKSNENELSSSKEVRIANSVFDMAERIEHQKQENLFDMDTMLKRFHLTAGAIENWSKSRDMEMMREDSMSSSCLEPGEDDEINASTLVSRRESMADTIGDGGCNIAIPKKVSLDETLPSQDYSRLSDVMADIQEAIFDLIQQSKAPYHPEAFDHRISNNEEDSLDVEISLLRQQLEEKQTVLERLKKKGDRQIHLQDIKNLYHRSHEKKVTHLMKSMERLQDDIAMYHIKIEEQEFHSKPNSMSTRMSHVSRDYEDLVKHYQESLKAHLDDIENLKREEQKRDDDRKRAAQEAKRQLYRDVRGRQLLKIEENIQILKIQHEALKEKYETKVKQREEIHNEIVSMIREYLQNKIEECKTSIEQAKERIQEVSEMHFLEAMKKHILPLSLSALEELDPEEYADIIDNFNEESLMEEKKRRKAEQLLLRKRKELLKKKQEKMKLTLEKSGGDSMSYGLSTAHANTVEQSKDGHSDYSSNDDGDDEESKAKKGEKSMKKKAPGRSSPRAPSALDKTTDVDARRKRRQGTTTKTTTKENDEEDNNAAIEPQQQQKSYKTAKSGMSNMKENESRGASTTKGAERQSLKKHKKKIEDKNLRELSLEDGAGDGDGAAQPHVSVATPRGSDEIKAALTQIDPNTLTVHSDAMKHRSQRMMNQVADQMMLLSQEMDDIDQLMENTADDIHIIDAIHAQARSIRSNKMKHVRAHTKNAAPSNSMSTLKYASVRLLSHLESDTFMSWRISYLKDSMDYMIELRKGGKIVFDDDSENGSDHLESAKSQEDAFLERERMLEALKDEKKVIQEEMSLKKAFQKLEKAFDELKETHQITKNRSDRAAQHFLVKLRKKAFEAEKQLRHDLVRLCERYKISKEELVRRRSMIDRAIGLSEVIPSLKSSSSYSHGQGQGHAHTHRERELRATLRVLLRQERWWQKRLERAAMEEREEMDVTKGQETTPSSRLVDTLSTSEAYSMPLQHSTMLSVESVDSRKARRPFLFRPSSVVYDNPATMKRSFKGASNLLAIKGIHLT